MPCSKMDAMPLALALQLADGRVRDNGVGSKIARPSRVANSLGCSSTFEIAVKRMEMGTSIMPLRIYICDISTTRSGGVLGLGRCAPRCAMFCLGVSATLSNLRAVLSYYWQAAVSADGCRPRARYFRCAHSAAAF